MLVGEPLGLFIAGEEGSLSQVSCFTAATAGAELNVAIGLSRLSHSVGYLTKLGRDPFAERIVNTMNKNSISTSLVTYDETRCTGFMLKSKKSKGDPEISYHRQGSAASQLCREDIDSLDFSGYGFLHMTGIFPALSPSTLDAAEYLMQKAKAQQMTVTFDPNLRPQLWESQTMMVETLNRLAGYADVILPGIAEGRLLTGQDTPEQIAEYYLSRGIRQVAVKTGSDGAYAASAEGGARIPGFLVKQVVDTVGAGDGFAAGVISALVEGLSFPDAVRRGNAIGAIQVMSVGDNEGLPTRQALADFMHEGGCKE